MDCTHQFQPYEFKQMEAFIVEDFQVKETGNKVFRVTKYICPLCGETKEP